MRNSVGKWLVGAAMSCMVVPATQALIISEYVEGRSNNKAIEITNLDPMVSSFSNVTIEIYRSGASTAPSVLNLPTFTLRFGESYVVTSTSAVPALIALSQAQVGAGSSWFNGDDAVVLKVGAVTHDIFGVIGMDPGLAWTSGSISTVGQSLRRSGMVCRGITTSPATFDLSAWAPGSMTDDFSNLGMHTHSCPGGGMPTTPMVTTIGAVQGNGMRSPMVGRMVTVEGVVTGASQSFMGNYDSRRPTYAYAPIVFIQSQTPDADPETSDGIAIHAGVAMPTPLPALSSPFPPAGFPASPLDWDMVTRSFGIAGDFPRLPLGSLIRVTGMVEEFRGDTRTLSCSMEAEEKCETRLRPTAITVVRAGSMPAPISLDAVLPDDVTNSNYFERFEGMYVTTGAPRYVSGPSVAYEDNAGPFISLDRRVPTAFDTSVFGSIRRLLAERAQYAVGVRNWFSRGRINERNDFPNNVAVGTLLAPVTGVMAFDYDRYRIVATPGTIWAIATPRPLPSQLDAIWQSTPATARKLLFATLNTEKAGSKGSETRVVNNMERVFALDIDADTSPVQAKLNKTALTIKQLGCPNIMALQEFLTPKHQDQNQNETEQPSTPPNPLRSSQALAMLTTILRSGQDPCNYTTVATSPPDFGGFGMALLVREGTFSSAVGVSDVSTWQDCHASGSNNFYATGSTPVPCPSGQFPLFTRRPIVLRKDNVALDLYSRRFDGAYQSRTITVPITVIVTHFKSQVDPTGEARRQAEAESVARLVSQEHAAGRKVVVLGDYNTAYARDSAFLAPLRRAGLVDNWDYVTPQLRFSYNYAGASGVLDHIMFSQDLIGQTSATLQTGSLAFNSDWPANVTGIPGASAISAERTLVNLVNSPLGLSDHDPVWLRLGGFGLGKPAVAGDCLLASACAAFSAVGGNPSFCGAARSGSNMTMSSNEEKSTKEEAKPVEEDFKLIKGDDWEAVTDDPLEPYRLFRDKVLLNSEKGAEWTNTYYALSPAVTDLVLQDPALGMDLLALMYRFADAFERFALGQAHNENDLLEAVDIERLQRLQQRVLDKLDPKQTQSLSAFPKPEALAQYEGKPAYALIKDLMFYAGL